MKIAYLTSQYPAISHTFIMREVHALRALGLEIDTYSIRRAGPQDCLDAASREELTRTGFLLPPRWSVLLRACLWVLLSRPSRAARALAWSTLHRGARHSGRLKGLAYFVEGVQLAHNLVHDGCEHVHCHFGNAGSNAGLIAARLAGIPFSMTCHGSELRDIHKNRLPEKVSASSFVACVTHFGKSQLMMGVRPESWKKIKVVRCGAPPVEPDSKDPCPNDTPQILCVARLSREKGHPILLDALALLREGGVPFRCTLVGDGPLRGEIENQIAAKRLTDHVELTGALPPADVIPHYRRADVVVLASFSEGAPVVLMEGMSYARPVVATNVGGVSELVEHGKTGMLVPPGDAAVLCHAIETTLSNPERSVSMGEAGKKLVNASFNIAKSADQLARLFRKQDAGVSVAEALCDTEASPC